MLSIRDKKVTEEFEKDKKIANREVFWLYGNLEGEQIIDEGDQVS